MMPLDPLTGGTVLRRPAIQSPNFSLSDKTGWAIFANGDAFFFNITAQGAVTANSVIISGAGDGLFIYQGTPGPGTLKISAVSAAGIDPYGNAYPTDIALHNVAGTGLIELRSDLSALLFYP